MPLIDGNQIAELATCLARRAKVIFHACQFRDLRSYLELGGVPSRQYLTESGLPFTPFQTDAVDHTNGVWDKVFFNLSDFGNGFASGNRGVPCPYGPITLVFNAQAVGAAVDASITLRSAGAADFNRLNEGLSLAETEKLFVRAGLQKYRLKKRDELVQQFPGRDIRNPEINCTYAVGFAPFVFLRYVLVDPYSAGGQTLAQHVSALFAARQLAKPVIPRDSTPARAASYATLWAAIRGGVSTVDELQVRQGIDEETHQWAQTLLEWDQGTLQFNRYCSYLRTGTIGEFD